MDEVGFIPLDWAKLPERVMLEQANLAYQENNSRRTTRHFSTQSVDRKLIELAIKSGSTAPNGAHLQPWTWVAVSNAELKQRIRIAAEEEERRTYDHRMPEAWAEVLSPLGTDAVKEHLTDAPWVVVLFKQKKRLRANGEWGPTYYATESCGIAAGLFINAVHRMGLVTLTHTPSPMKFLADLLDRPSHEEAMLVMPVGYPAPGAKVPDIHRKSLEEISIFMEE
ncbi:nitroreductase family protein [Candidatus Poseidoniaceae archaeon]|nr:nitroreductase family protein [Candidatus Poseidoniaceae archaeon]|tara:strand:- start:112 stop:783 length:672 start_codon:yes stop_codon:yes gene_type:complete